MEKPGFNTGYYVDIKYYKNIKIHVIRMQVLADIVTHPSYFERVFHNLYVVMFFFLDDRMQPLFPVRMF